MTKRHIVIATRESPLALYQAESVKAWLTAAHPSLSVELLGITTEADRCLDITLNAIGGDRKSTRLNSSHSQISYAVFCFKKNNVLDAATVGCDGALIFILRRLPFVRL